MEPPYSGLGRRAFWRSGVVDQHPFAIGDLYRKKFSIRESEKIATAGSCFAQHVASRLREHGFDVLDTEPPPYGIDMETAKQFGFCLYSARYGNIYTVRQLLQLIQECRGLRHPAEIVWERGGRYFDALRPSVEPSGFESPELVLRHRAQHLDRVRRVFDQCSLVAFTLGLTETWEQRGDGTVFPTAPGTIAGEYSPSAYRFRNLSYEENLSDFIELRELLVQQNPDMRFILTVSPVPLTATASKDHVLVATTRSKAVLRAVAGALSERYDNVDYFPAYEIISGTQARGIFYESNLRNVSSVGVDCVMSVFFSEHGEQSSHKDQTHEDGQIPVPPGPTNRERQSQKEYCEELLLDAFRP